MPSVMTSGGAVFDLRAKMNMGEVLCCSYMNFLNRNSTGRSFPQCWAESLSWALVPHPPIANLRNSNLQQGSAI